MAAKAEELSWEQLPGESKIAYDWFCRYRDMGHGRSLDKVRLEFSATSTKTITKRGLAVHSGRHRWVDRVKLYDEHLDQIRLRTAAENAAKWELRREADLEEAYQHSLVSRRVGEQILKYPLVTREVVVESYDDGRPKTVHIFTPSKWTLRDGPLLMSSAYALAAECHAAMALDPAAMSDEELEAVANAGGGPCGSNTSTP